MRGEGRGVTGEERERGADEVTGGRDLKSYQIVS